MTRKGFLRGTATALFVAATGGVVEAAAEGKRRQANSPKQVASKLLKLANEVSEAQMSKVDREKLAEELEVLSHKVATAYNVGALCETDVDCGKKFGRK